MQSSGPTESVTVTPSDAQVAVAYLPLQGAQQKAASSSFAPTGQVAMPSPDAEDELMSALSRVPYLDSLCMTAPRLIYQPPTVLQLRNAGAQNVHALTEAYSGLPTIHAQTECGPYAQRVGLANSSPCEVVYSESLWLPEPVEWDMVVSELLHAGARPATREEQVWEEEFWNSMARKRQRESDQSASQRRARRKIAQQERVRRTSMSSVAGSNTVARGPPSVFESAFNTPLSRQPSLTASAHTPSEGLALSTRASPSHRHHRSTPPPMPHPRTVSRDAGPITPAQRTAKGLLRRARYNEATIYRPKLAPTSSPAHQHDAADGFRFPILSTRSLTSTVSAYPDNALHSAANSSEMTPTTARTGVTDGWCSPMAMTMVSNAGDVPRVAAPQMVATTALTRTPHTPHIVVNDTNNGDVDMEGHGGTSAAQKLPSRAATVRANASTNASPPAADSTGTASYELTELVATPLGPADIAPTPSGSQATRPGTNHPPSLAALSTDAQNRTPGKGQIRRHSTTIPTPPSRAKSAGPRDGATVVSRAHARAPASASTSSTTATTRTEEAGARVDESRPPTSKAATAAADPSDALPKSEMVARQPSRIRLPPLSLPANVEESPPSTITAQSSTAAGKDGPERLTPLNPSTSYYSDGSAHRIHSSSRSVKAAASMTMVMAPEPVPAASTDSGSRITTHRSLTANTPPPTTTAPTRSHQPSSCTVVVDSPTGVGRETPGASVSVEPVLKTLHLTSASATTRGDAAVTMKRPVSAKPVKGSRPRPERRDADCASGGAVNETNTAALGDGEVSNTSLSRSLAAEKRAPLQPPSSTGSADVSHRRVPAASTMTDAAAATPRAEITVTSTTAQSASQARPSTPPAGCQGSPNQPPATTSSPTSRRQARTVEAGRGTTSVADREPCASATPRQADSPASSAKLPSSPRPTSGQRAASHTVRQSKLDETTPRESSTQKTKEKGSQCCVLM